MGTGTELEPMSARKLPGRGGGAGRAAGAGVALLSPQGTARNKQGRAGADGDSVGARSGEDELLMEWVSLTPECSRREGAPEFTKRCAHGLAALGSGSGSSHPGGAGGGVTIAVVGGCNETEYFPAEDVRARARACVNLGRRVLQWDCAGRETGPHCPRTAAPHPV